MSYINNRSDQGTLDHQIRVALNGTSGQILAMYSENEQDDDYCMLISGMFDNAAGITFQIDDPLYDEKFVKNLADSVGCTPEQVRSDPMFDLGCFASSVAGINVVNVPGVKQVRCQAGDPMEIMKIFAAEHQVTGFQLLSARRAENFAHRYRKALGLGMPKEIYRQHAQEEKRKDKKNKRRQRREKTEDLFDMFSNEYKKKKKETF